MQNQHKSVNKNHTLLGILARWSAAWNLDVAAKRPHSGPYHIANDLLFCVLRERFVHGGRSVFHRGQRTDGIETSGPLGIGSALKVNLAKQIHFAVSRSDALERDRNELYWRPNLALDLTGRRCPPIGKRTGFWR